MTAVQKPCNKVVGATLVVDLEIGTKTLVWEKEKNR